jgi:beta-glucosidase
MTAMRIAQRVLLCAGMLALCESSLAGAAKTPLYLDASQPIDVRIDDLLGRMTLAEKIGQINMPCVYENRLGRDVRAKTQGCQKFTLGQSEPGVGPGGGFFTLANTILLEGSVQQAKFFNELQQLAMTQTRLGIPLLQTEEGTHGLMCSLGTIFPEGPGLGSMWNLDLVRALYAAAAKEARAVGIHQLCTLVVEPIRDPRLGRNQEAYSEDPFFCSRMAQTIVETIQGHDLKSPEHVVAVLCHYPGQSQPVSGLERGAMEISERTLRSVFLVPWAAGIKKAGALGVMATYPAIDGVPTHGSEWILTKILREELTFDGLVLSEGGGLGTLLYEGLARNGQEAGALALRAGVDVGISYESAYMQDMARAIEQGLVPESLLDRAVRRILKTKFRLGLFESPLVDVTRAEQVVHNAEHQRLALQAAREGIVLLKNQGNLLPLSKNVESIAVIGPNADQTLVLTGNYMGTPTEPVSVLAGIRALVAPETQVNYARGCEIIGGSQSGFDEAVQAAKKSQVAVMVVGLSQQLEGEEGQQEGNPRGVTSLGDRTTLDLPPIQDKLIQAIYGTGTPVILVLLNGSAVSINWANERVPAILEAWYPGQAGGTAVAEALFGLTNPGGRLPVTFYRSTSDLPAFDDYGMKNRTYRYFTGQPLYSFGFGLSYTAFTYRNLQIVPAKVKPGDPASIQVEVENTGQHLGDEVVQLYLKDVEASLPLPLLQLQGFARIRLAPGEKQIVRFTLTAEQMSFADENGKWVLEPGEFKVWVGGQQPNQRTGPQPVNVMEGQFTVQA